MADTIDETVGGNDVLPAIDAGYSFTLQKKYDCRTVALGGDGNVTSGDTLQLLNIPAGVLVERVAIEMDTVEGAALTVDVGDGDDADGFLDGSDLNAAATKISSLVLVEAAPNTILGYSNGKFYLAADTLDMLFNNTADAAIFTVTVWCVRIEKAASITNPIGSV